LQNIGYLTTDGNHIDIARYPNRTAVEPWLRTTTWTENSDGTNTVVTCDGLKSHSPNTDDYFNGANMRWHGHSWWFETRGILDYVASTGRLYLGDKSIIAVEPYDKNGWGFYLDNKFEELDAPAEYYYDQANGKVYLWAPGGINPNDAVVEASTTTGGLAVSNCTVRNIGFRHQRSYGLQITGATIVENCRFEFIGSDDGAGRTAQSEMRVYIPSPSISLASSQYTLRVSSESKTVRAITITVTIILVAGLYCGLNHTKGSARGPTIKIASTIRDVRKYHFVCGCGASMTSSPQYRHFIASSRISSAQKGHFFICLRNTSDEIRTPAYAAGAVLYLSKLTEIFLLTPLVCIVIP